MHLLTYMIYIYTYTHTQIYIYILTPTYYQSQPRVINPFKLCQELRLLAHVFDTAPSGDPAAVCDAIERFGEDVLNPAGQWLKAPMAGGE